jgi:hypothetical protein
LETESAVSSNTFLSSRSEVSRYSTSLKSTRRSGRLAISTNISESRGMVAAIFGALPPAKNSK